MNSFVLMAKTKSIHLLCLNSFFKKAEVMQHHFFHVLTDVK